MIETSPIAQAIANRLTRVVPVKPMRIRLRAPIASFTFDDFAKSALSVGGRAVEDYGGRATYYTAGALCGGMENGAQCYDESDLAAAAERGHEVGCHTYDHAAVPDLPSRAIEENLLRNREFLLRVTGQSELTSFAYPFGRASLRTKKLLSGKFTACRGVYPGINAGWTDLSQLNAIPLYNENLDIEKYIRRAKNSPGWVIFIGHDVSQDHSSCGCTLKWLEDVLRMVSSAGIEIVPVGTALNRILRG
jgi:peptidoglycan/xylan/chitin deacetylase (PgdA/CDA1 family)